MRLLSFRFRILALVLGVAIVPLVLIGIVLLRGADELAEVHQALLLRVRRVVAVVRFKPGFADHALDEISERRLATGCLGVERRPPAAQQQVHIL